MAKVKPSDPLGVSDPTAALWAAREYLRRADRSISEHDYDPAIKMLQNTAELGLSPLDMTKELLPFLDNHSDELISAGYGNSLVAIYQVYQKANPDSDDPYVIIADTYERMKAWDKAVDTYQQLIQRFPQHAPAYYGLGQLYLRMGRKVEAAREFEIAVAKRPDWELPYASLIPLLIADGQKDKALALLQAAAASNSALEWPQQEISSYNLLPQSQ